MNISWLKTSNILVFQIQLIVEVPVFKNKLSRIYKAITFDNCLVILKGHLCATRCLVKLAREIFKCLQPTNFHRPTCK